MLGNLKDWHRNLLGDSDLLKAFHLTVLCSI